ncbi:MAG: Hydrolase, TatD family [Pedosphaera sp.]|nr:Hydrolase, TatD family [Pedosphaera sp.]
MKARQCKMIVAASAGFPQLRNLTLSPTLSRARCEYNVTNIMATFYDTHAHLDFPDYGADLPGVIERAQAAGITKIITIGTDLESSARAVKLCEQYPMVYAAVGWHPTSALEAPDDLRPALRELASHPKVVAIGETGLDYHHLPSETPGSTIADDEKYKQKQAHIFRQQMEVASEFGLNCVIHQRSALEDTLAQMQPFVGRVRGVYHCFVDNPDTVRRVLAMNSLVSFTGIVTFKNAQTVRDSVLAAPLGQFMLETDSPYLAPVPYRGKRCEPAYVKEISGFVAQVKGCSLEDLSAATCATAHEFFPKLK